MSSKIVSSHPKVLLSRIYTILEDFNSDQIPWHFGVKNQHFGQNHDCSKSQPWLATFYNPVSSLISAMIC